MELSEMRSSYSPTVIKKMFKTNKELKRFHENYCSHSKNNVSSEPSPLDMKILASFQKNRSLGKTAKEFDISYDKAKSAVVRASTRAILQAK